jgi:hypothetical protein
MVTFLLNHTHAWHCGEPEEIPYNGKGPSKSLITSELALFDSKVINQNIRTN